MQLRPEGCKVAPWPLPWVYPRFYSLSASGSNSFRGEVLTPFSEGMFGGTVGKFRSPGAVCFVPVPDLSG